MPTADIRFTSEGISATAYADDESSTVLDESWYSWDEVEEMKSVASGR